MLGKTYEIKKEVIVMEYMILKFIRFYNIQGCNGRVFWATIKDSIYKKAKEENILIHNLYCRRLLYCDNITYCNRNIPVTVFLYIDKSLHHN